jgi:hypothetical protein
MSDKIASKNEAMDIKYVSLWERFKPIKSNKIIGAMLIIIKG